MAGVLIAEAKKKIRFSYILMFNGAGYDVLIDRRPKLANRMTPAEHIYQTPPSFIIVLSPADVTLKKCNYTAANFGYQYNT